jgi:chemotaxis protein MotB
MLHRIFRPKFDDVRSQNIWLTVYADMITNLVLLFLALYSLVMMGDEALIKAVQSMKLEEITHAKDLPKNLEITDIAGLLRDEFKGSLDISIKEEAGATRISFGENVLFPSGSAALHTSARPIINGLANLLRLVPFTIIVEGHTDDVPLKSGTKYKDNWELSLARAMAVVDLLAQSDIPPNQMAAAAYGSFRPVASNLTRSGRQLNRRVEVALFKEFPYELR